MFEVQILIVDYSTCSETIILCSAVYICSISLLAPTLTVAVKPAEVVALDLRPYNIFTLRCIANASEGVVQQKSFIWRSGDDVISDNGNTILIADHNTMLPSSTSELTVYRPEIGTYMYLCEVRILVPGGHNISTNNSGRATVKGNMDTQISLL